MKNDNFIENEMVFMDKSITTKNICSSNNVVVMSPYSGICVLASELDIEHIFYIFEIQPIQTSAKTLNAWMQSPI